MSFIIFMPYGLHIPVTELHFVTKYYKMIHCCKFTYFVCVCIYIYGMKIIYVWTFYEYILFYSLSCFSMCERWRPVITSLSGNDGDIVPLLMLTVQLRCRGDKPSVWGDAEQSLWIWLRINGVPERMKETERWGEVAERQAGMVNKD